jgi:hypothetical protein
MVVLGGDPVALTGGCAACSSQSLFNCNPLGSVVDLMFDSGIGVGIESVDQYAVTLLDDIGIMNGLVVSTAVQDCECRVDSPCVGVGATDLCTFGNVPTTMAMQGTNPLNCGRATEDEPAILKSVLGCR